MIDQIEIKTGDFINAGSNDAVPQMTICDREHVCCQIDILTQQFPKGEIKKLKKDHEMFFDAKNLDFTGPLQLTLTMMGEQWFVDWVRVSLGKRKFFCPILGWFEFYDKKWTREKDHLRILGPQERKVMCTYEGKL